MNLLLRSFRAGARLLALAAAILVAVPTGATAATLTWSATGTSTAIGGTGTWDTTALQWTADGSAWTNWVNANVDTAVFAGTAGTVTLNSGITAGGLTFETTGYTITGNTLTLAGIGLAAAALLARRRRPARRSLSSL